MGDGSCIAAVRSSAFTDLVVFVCVATLATGLSACVAKWSCVAPSLFIVNDDSIVQWLAGSCDPSTNRP